MIITIMKIHRLIAQILLADDYKFLKKTQVTFVDTVVARSALLDDSPLEGKRCVVFECPNVFRQFSSFCCFSAERMLRDFGCSAL